MKKRLEFLERMTVVPRGVDALEALYHRGRGVLPVVLAPGHPRLYGTMESAALAELAWALSQRGHPTLRFNYRGIGASTGSSSVAPLLERLMEGGPHPPLEPAALDEAYEDLCAAIEHHLETCGARSCGVVGYSFGAALAARAGALHERVERVVLVAPPVLHLPFDLEALSSSGTAVYVVAGELDRVAPPGAIEAQIAGRFGVHRISGANHELSRGLSPLGQHVASAFPDSQERPAYDD